MITTESWFLEPSPTLKSSTIEMLLENLTIMIEAKKKMLFSLKVKRKATSPMKMLIEKTPMKKPNPMGRELLIVKTKRKKMMKRMKMKMRMMGVLRAKKR